MQTEQLCCVCDIHKSVRIETNLSVSEALK